MNPRGEPVSSKAVSPADRTPHATGFSRRQIVGTGIALGLFGLAGCQPKGGSTTAGLPDPWWTQDQPIITPQPTTGTGPGPIAPRPQVAQQPLPADPGPMPGVIGRSQWTGKGVARMSDINPMNGVRRVTIHHDGMPPVSLGSPAQVRARLEQIRQSHVVGRGWADIGYHYVIDPSGRVWEGRAIRYQGAHVKDQNENNLGILVLGNFDRQNPTPPQIQALDRFVAAQMQRYRISMRDVRTHRERAPTECPGRNLQGYLNRTRNQGGQMAMLAARMGLA